MAEKKTTEEIKDYSSMKKDELLALAKDMGAKVNTKTRKADIIAAIEAIEKESEVEAAEPAEEKEPEVEATEASETEEVAESTEEKEPEAEETEATEAEAETEASAALDTAKEILGTDDEAELDTTEADADTSETEEEEKELSSTERKRKMKAERREAKAARKEANRVEEKKKRPSNLLLAILIFGVLIGMFAFVGGYNYFSKPASIEAYFDETGMADMYTNVQYDEHSTITVRADGNTIKMLIKVDEDIEDEHLEEYTSEEATDNLKSMGAGFLTSVKPEVRGFGGTVKVGVKKGDETINYVKMSYSEAKKFIKEQEEQAEEDADAAEDAAEDAEDAAEDAAEEAED